MPFSSSKCLSALVKIAPCGKFTKNKTDEAVLTVCWSQSARCKLEGIKDEVIGKLRPLMHSIEKESNYGNDEDYPWYSTKLSMMMEMF